MLNLDVHPIHNVRETLNIKCTLFKWFIYTMPRKESNSQEILIQIGNKRR